MVVGNISIVDTISIKYSNFDYYYNQIWKGLSKKTALKDKAHDKAVNKTGRQRAKSGVYRNAKDACKLYRVRGINDKY